ncbi:hypothetical protein M8756_12090 [Lutimaribacter sp. EGI FJ00015]|uniref:Uncharacterized protein n=1 Tax=Lutimaribacter degradans TaxID=2945989 RepID=A0ACC5ZX66_9RHOB|nr:hypothetical protein [Lutimaribacter sp. EGI FJ00013]MCM2562892.1 hypothetical protein [Lutimaribacter sp. EGI FJ00013]MCO0614049.1 hypothetical protein [Lutimaribacter sp. EGI FJ00015]MCO0637021.1 hypothetical protein [Lutimaribacter sp. EGI FJ00014]
MQDQNAQGDAIATGVALVLFWPAAFFVGGDKENAAERSRLKGEMEASEQASIQKTVGLCSDQTHQRNRKAISFTADKWTSRFAA